MLRPSYVFFIAHYVRWMERPRKNFSDEIFPHSRMGKETNRNLTVTGNRFAILPSKISLPPKFKICGMPQILNFVKFRC